MSSGLIGLGAAVAAMGIGAIVAPHMLVRESKRNHARRLQELEDGAPEAYLEEKRELEAYRPRFDLSHKTIRMLGVFALVLGGGAVLLGLA